MWIGIFLILLHYTYTVNGDYRDPHCDGKQVIVHLFEWKWTDVADECERFLSKKHFCGVQVSPPNEHVVVTHPMRPWWERYQPVSYKLHSRGGTEAEFKDMVVRCKNVGVRIYVDAVVNHMAVLGRIGIGTAGSHFNSSNYDFPGVPYSRQHFNSRDNCPSGNGGVDNYSDPKNVRNCFLVGLTDLDQSQEYVRDEMAEYFNHCIDIGVAGFRIDASKYMWPGDVKVIQDRVKDLPEGGRPFFYHEVIDQNDGAVKVNEYYELGFVTEFRYCQKIAYGIHDFGQLNNMYVPSWGMSDPSHAFVFVDNHDNQRGHGGGGNLITHKTPRDYKMAVAFTLAYNYGFTRVMSSYFFDNTDQGPPDNADFSAKDVTINSDGSCGNGWVCEHRWNPIANMAAFRNSVAGTEIKNWRNQNDEISFARGHKGFFAMAKQGHMDRTLQTGLPAGEYCELVSDCKKKIKVDGSGHAHIVIDNSAEPILAFIVDYHPQNQTSNLVPTLTTHEQRATEAIETRSTNQIISAATAQQAACDSCDDLLTSQCANSFQPCDGVCLLQNQPNRIQTKCTTSSECKYKQTLGLLFPGTNTICCKTDNCFQKELFNMIQGHIATTTRPSKVLVTIKK